jgi:hypothetical protein
MQQPRCTGIRGTVGAIWRFTSGLHRHAGVIQGSTHSLSTSDVRDGQGHIVQFTTADELIWLDGTHISGHQLDGPGHQLQGNVAPEASCQCCLVVRFGAADGEIPGRIVRVDKTLMPRFAMAIGRAGVSST